jgi:hypothetical protein
LSKKTLVKLAAWGSAVLGVFLSLYVWGSLLGWQLDNLTAYSLFPVLGLLAYGLMISHYLAATVRQATKQPKELLEKYFTITSVVVLVCILLHPSLLIYQLWADGNGLPPDSYTSYVSAGLVVWIYVGTLSWLAFLLYELRHKFNTRPWWRYVQYASDVAMIGIFFHALMLGQHLAVPWFRAVWYGYGVILLGSLLYSYTRKRA